MQQEVVLPRGCDGGVSKKGGPDVLEIKTRVFFLAACYRMARFVTDGKFNFAAEVVLAIAMDIALYVPQRV